MKNKKLWFVAKIGLTLAFILLGIAYFVSQKDAFLKLEWPSATAVTVVSVAFTMNLFLGSLFNTIAARKLGAGLSITDSFSMSTVTSAVNFVVPLRAGTGLRAMYMKKVFNFSYAHFASTLLMFYLMNLLIASLIGMLSVWVIYLDRGYFRLDLFLILPLIFLTAGSLMMIRKGTGRDGQQAQSWLHSLWAGFQSIVLERNVLLYSLLIVMASFVVSTLGWTVALREYAPGITIAESFMIVASQVVSGLVSLTSGGTGFQELAGLYVGHRLNITLVELFAVLVWTKVVRMLISFMLALPSFIYLKSKMNGAALRE